MAIDDAYRLTVVSRLSGQQFLNTYAFNVITETPLTLADFTTLATDAKDALRTVQHTAYTFTNWRAAQLRGSGVTPVQGKCTTTGGQVFEGNYTTNTNGSSASGDLLPYQCAMVFTINTGLIGRRRRGRLFYAGFGETDQAASIWVAGVVTAATTAFNLFFNKYAGASPTSPNFRLGVWSYRIATGCERDPNPPYGHVQVESPNLADAFRVATGSILRTTVHTQRRRVIGVGR